MRRVSAGSLWILRRCVVGNAETAEPSDLKDREPSDLKDRQDVGLRLGLRFPRSKGSQLGP